MTPYDLRGKMRRFYMFDSGREYVGKRDFPTLMDSLSDLVGQGMLIPVRGESIWWCEEHEVNGLDEEGCGWGWESGQLDECRMVEQLRIEMPE